MKEFNQVKGRIIMSIARARTIRATAAAAALLAAGIASSASAEQARGLTNSNIAAASSSSAATASTAQRRSVADPVVCVRDQRVMSRITQDFCRTSSEWERRGGFLPDQH